MSTHLLEVIASGMQVAWQFFGIFMPRSKNPLATCRTFLGKANCLVVVAIDIASAYNVSITRIEVLPAFSALEVFRMIFLLYVQRRARLSSQVRSRLFSATYCLRPHIHPGWAHYTQHTYYQCVASNPGSTRDTPRRSARRKNIFDRRERCCNPGRSQYETLSLACMLTMSDVFVC